MLLLDIPQTADRLATSERHVRYLVTTRRLTFVKVGGLLRFRAPDIDAYIAANLHPAAAS